MGFFDKGVCGEEFDEPKCFSEFLDIFLHGSNDAGCQVIVEIVKLFTQFNCLLQKFFIDQFFKLGKIIFKERTVEGFLLLEIKFHGSIPNFEVG